jgi:nucleotide-binding universal stress UspA family protein
MFERILFPTDGSEAASTVFDHVLDVAEAHDATLHVLSVADTAHDSVTRIEGRVIDVLEREGERVVDEAAERAGNRRVSVVTDVLQGGVPETITAYAAEYDIDLVAMPTQGRTGLDRLLLGSTTERVLRQTTVPVLTLRPDDPARYPYRDVLVPTDGSACASAALDRALAVATATGATLHVLSVVDATSLGTDVYSGTQVEVLEEDAQTVVTEARTAAEDAPLESVVEAVEFGSSVTREIRSYADEHGIDLVVMGTHGRTGVERHLLGSVAEKTVRSTPVPVLTVPDPGSG